MYLKSVFFGLFFTCLTPNFAYSQKIPVASIMDSIFCKYNLKANDTIYLKRNQTLFNPAYQPSCLIIIYYKNKKEFNKYLKEKSKIVLISISQPYLDSTALICKVSFPTANYKEYRETGYLTWGEYDYRVVLGQVVSDSYTIKEVIFPGRVRILKKKK